MKEPRLQLVLLLLFSLFSTPTFASTIVDTLPLDTVEPANWGGYWFGTAPFDPITYSVGEKFTTYRDYSQITGAVLLYNPGVLPEPLPLVSFSIVADNVGIPGDVLAVTSFNLINRGGPPTIYALDFPSLVLQDATNYWLVASSSSIGNTPIWPDRYPGEGYPDFISYTGSQSALNLNGSWGQFLDYATRFALYGTEIGDPVNNGAGPKYNIPEPPSLLLLGFGLVGLAWWRRKQHAS